jgi:uncharacterized membrane protein
MQSVMKWVASIGLGLVTALALAAQQYFTGAAVEWADNTVVMFALTVLSKLVGWLVGKIPAPTTL